MVTVEIFYNCNMNIIDKDSNFKCGNFNKDRFLIVLPVVLCFLYLIWAFVLPVSKAPDEFTRLQVPFFIINNGFLPNGFEESIRNRIWGISYAFTTYGASLIALPFIKFASLFTDNMEALIFAARIPSCLFGSLTVAVLMKASNYIGFNLRSRLLLGISMGLLPQFAFLSSYHNQDIFSIFCASLVVLSWVKAIRDGWSVKVCVYMGTSLGLLALSYYFAYTLIPLSVVFFFITAKWQKLSFKRMIQYAFLIFAVAFAIAGWFFVRNFIIYDGDFFGRRAYYECSEAYAMDDYKPSNHITAKMEGKTILAVLFSAEWLWMTFESCISYLGYMQFPLPEWAYVLPLIIFCFAFCFSFKFCVLQRGSELFEGCAKGSSYTALLWFLLAILSFSTLILSGYYSWSADWEPQGRYIICAWIPAFLALETCAQHITKNLLKTKAKKNYFICLCVGFSVLLLIFSIYSAYPGCFRGIMFEYDL